MIDGGWKYEGSSRCCFQTIHKSSSKLVASLATWAFVPGMYQFESGRQKDKYNMLPSREDGGHSWRQSSL